LKRRFFFIILTVVTATVVAVSFVFSTFSANERLRLLDQQIESHASLLLSSGLSGDQLSDFEEADTIITDVLGGTRINQVIVIYNRKGDPIYQNKNAALLQLNLPALQRMTNVDVSGQTLRLLTVPFPAKKRTLQIGLVINDTVDRWEIFNHRVWAYLALIILMALFISFVLTNLLMQPVQQLGGFLRHLTDQFDTGLSSSAAEPFRLLTSKRLNRKDEFVQLTLAIQALLEKIRNALKLNNTRSAQLAHELKTPLTVMRNNLEGMRKGSGERLVDQIQDCLSETDRLSDTINNFLEWSVTENTPGLPQDIHAIALGSFVADSLKSLESLYPKRISLTERQPATVFAKPAHLEQVVTNLALNALKHSPPQSSVRVAIDGDCFTVENQGGGIPPRVLERIGTPFNLGSSTKGSPERGSGLGLAWIHTICGKYQWPLDIRNTGEGTSASVTIRTGDPITSRT
jgi:signal transduction histidine kinase